MANVGFIGLGIMGAPMCENLLKAGHSVVVYDHKLKKSRSIPVVDRMVRAGASPAMMPREVAAQSQFVILMLPDGPQVEEVVLGSEGVLEGTKAGSLVIDMSSVNPLVSQKIGAACDVKGVKFLDAPVSGGEPKAIEGTLAIMVGGDEQAFTEAEPLLRVMGSTVTRTGPVGAGNVTKLANQIIVACNIAAMGEALVLAARAGVDPANVFDAIKGGLAGSAVLNAKAPMVLSRNFKPGFRIRLHEKDLRNALLTAESMKVGLPLTSLVQQMLISLINHEKGDLDHSGIVMFLEEMANTVISKGNAINATAH